MKKSLQAAKAYVKRCFDSYLPQGFYYHNWQHTAGVVRICATMTEQQSPNQREALLLAAWFHDLGYLSSLDNHEAHSITWWKAYAAPLERSESLVQQVIRCIEATRLGSAAADELAAQLADADLAYSLADGAFEARGNALRQEWAALLNRSYSEEAWRNLQASFLQEASFQSAYGKEYFQPKLEKLCLHFSKS